MALGQVRTYGSSNQEAPPLITGTGGRLLGSQSKVAAGLMASQNRYAAAAFTIDSSIVNRSSLNWRSTLSQASEEGVVSA